MSSLTASPSASQVVNTSAEVNLARPLVWNSKTVTPTAPVTGRPKPTISYFNGEIYTLPAIGTEPENTMVVIITPCVLPTSVCNGQGRHLEPLLLPSCLIEGNVTTITVPFALFDLVDDVSQRCKCGDFDGATAAVQEFLRCYENIISDLTKMREEKTSIAVKEWEWLKFSSNFKHVFERMELDAGWRGECTIQVDEDGFLVVSVGKSTHAIHDTDVAAMLMWAKEFNVPVEWTH